eukprot:GFUD01089595.1.p1 GENE.GFUD01089595.1~~GFUD01089595.1.p1  ORF type:complete len:399 (+),score=80.90 GFUD01089595.1:2-1198(+)
MIEMSNQARSSHSMRISRKRKKRRIKSNLGSWQTHSLSAPLAGCKVSKGGGNYYINATGTLFGPSNTNGIHSTNVGGSSTNGLSPNNGMASPNGISSTNVMASSNKISSKNTRSSSNEMTSSNGMASTSGSNIPSTASSSSVTAQAHPISIQAVNPTQQLLQHLPSVSASVSAMPLPQMNNVFHTVAPNTIGISTLAVSSSNSPTPSSTPAANIIQQYLQRLSSATSSFPTLSSSRGYSRRSRLNNPMSMGGKSIKAIKYIENESLRGRFNSCKAYFLSRGIPNDERLVFHGTSADLDSIIKQNLKLSLCKRFAFGKGVYFSEFPSTSQVYGKHLLLFRVMLGNPYQGREHIIPAQYQSKIVQPNEEGKANMIIIDNEDQILPAFIIELQDLEPPVSI